jgi:hypothetical protein
MSPETQEFEIGRIGGHVAIAETYLEAIRSKDPAKALLAPDVTLQFPLTARKVAGRENVIDHISALFPGIDDVKIERHLTGGEYVATLWEAHSVWGVLHICSVFHISGGVIREVRSFWDPRPVLGIHP